MIRQTLTIPFRAPNLNDLLRLKAGSAAARSRRSAPHTSRRGYDGYAEVKAQWAAIVRAYALNQRIQPVESANVHFLILETDRRRDPDGLCSATSKFVLDGLVKCGVLPGDGWRCINGLSFSWGLAELASVVVTLASEAE